MTLEKAFAHFLETPDLVKKAELSENSRRQFSWRLETEPGTIRMDTMKKWLLAAGFKEDSIWSPPVIENPA